MDGAQGEGARRMTSIEPVNAAEAEETITRVSRRGVLAIGGVIGAAGLVAACGSSGSESQPATSEATATGGTAPSTPATGGAPGDALAPVSDIPVGGGQVFDANKVVVTQPVEGTIRGFTAVCPHQGCLVSRVENNEIVCPCHGSYFDADTGEVLRGPATRGLAAANVGIEDGFIVLP
jgi:nitrite reductase/ring-hydroxylating ferredoxin subunit